MKYFSALLALFLCSFVGVNAQEVYPQQMLVQLAEGASPRDLEIATESNFHDLNWTVVSKHMNVYKVEW